MLFGGDLLNSPLLILLWWIPMFFFMFYAQRFQVWMALNDVARSLRKLQTLKEKSRKETIDYVTNVCKPEGDPTGTIDQFLEYFTILPVDLDPAGIVKKIDHIVNLRDERMRSEIRRLFPSTSKVQTSNLENIIEVATALNFIYKVIRHYYLMGKRTSSYFIIIQVQAVLPLIMQEAEALLSAVDAFKQSQPIGDGVGAMVIAKMTLGKEKKTMAKDTVLSESEFKGRTLYLIKAEGPGGNVGQPGTAIARLIEEMGVKIDAVVMIDAALKLEGEKTGEIAEGIGAAIGGIGVDRFKIEEVASKHNIPLYAIVIKQSILDAISLMKKEIAEAVEKVLGIVNRVIEEKTKEGDRVLVVGVGNTIGIS